MRTEILCIFQDLLICEAEHSNSELGEKRWGELEGVRSKGWGQVVTEHKGRQGTIRLTEVNVEGRRI